MADRRTQLTEADRDRVEAVFQEHQRFVENVARQHAHVPDHASDIAQAVALRLCRGGLNGFRGDAEIRTWLYRVTVNEARTYYRRERRDIIRPRDEVVAKPVPEAVLDPDDLLEAHERVSALRDGIRQLPPHRQQLIGEHLAENVVLRHRRHARYLARQQLRAVLRDDPRLA